jgi:virginiamycin B lyase
MAVGGLIVAQRQADPPAAAAPASVAPAVTAADTVPITQWVVPWERSRPRDPYADPTSSRIWFVGQVGNYLAWLDPATGKFGQRTLPPNALPHNLIVDDDGSVWYAGNGDSHIGHFNPKTDQLTRIAMPDSSARDPHTLVFGRGGVIWFTAQGANVVGRLNKATRKVELVRVPTQRARPYGIALDSKGRPWFNEFGTNKIGTIDPATLALREYTLPSADARTRRIAVTADDMVWFVDYARGMLGRLDPASGKVAEWALPSGAESRPYGMALDDRGMIWTVESGVQPNQLVGFDPRTERVFSVTPIRNAGGNNNSVRHIVFDARTGSLWFGTDAGTIARARVR